MTNKPEDTKALKECIASLLERIDEMVAAPPCQFEIDGVVVPDEGGHSLHVYGQTPDWYVEAVYLATYGVKPEVPAVISTEKPTVEDLDREVTARSDVLIADAKRQEKAWVDFITDVIERHKHLPEHLVEAVLVRQFKRIETETE